MRPKAKISISTLEKGLSGQRQLTEQTLTRLEDVLGVKLRAVAGEAAIAPEGLGVLCAARRSRGSKAAT
ncbi:MAG: hypothetical protein HC855_01455 [Rhizobiales bacterium]|nr:hypothetical protein [Hyphomicrobiales bacterium]